MRHHCYCSRKVNRFVCRMLRARSASRSSITHEILISLAPASMLAGYRLDTMLNLP